MKIPFTLEWYLQQKESLRSDTDIGAEFSVTRDTVRNWKIKLGWIAGDGYKYSGNRGSKVDLVKLARLYEEGCSCLAIAHILKVTDTTVHYHLGRLGLKQRVGV